jgi:hypothetical protein
VNIYEYMVTVVSFSRVCCKQWGGQTFLKYPKRSYELFFIMCIYDEKKQYRVTKK